ncbi:MAG TPA: glycosyltransferase [Acidimicrobiales bacterium]|nr:glycosyltransferase [Acidimicrobiales bacterium]
MGVARQTGTSRPGAPPEAVDPADGGEAARHQVTLLVLAPTAAGQLDDCLGTVRGAQSVDVVVVDRPASALVEAARAHPAVDRVVLTTDRVPGALVGRALWSLRTGAALVLEATARPPAGWIDESLAALRAAGPVGVAWVPTVGAGAVAVDVDALRTAWWRDGLARVPPGDTPRDVWEWMVEARPAPPGVVPVGRPLPPAPPAAPYGALISVVVCSHGRPRDLARLLASVQHLDDPAWELLVVDNGSRPQYDPAMVEAAGGRYVHEPRRGLDHARNRGWQEARGEVVAYVDDDCEVDPGWLGGLREVLGDPSVGLVTGRVVPASLARPTERWFEAWFGFDRGLQPDRCSSDDRRPWAALYPSLLGTGANMAFRRSILEQVGGFDELLDVGTSIGGGGDIDAFARVLDTGVVGHYAPAAVVRHHHRRDVGALRRQFFGYGQALGAVCTKHALDRPGHKRAAVRFYRERLRDQLRRARARGGRSTLPRSLTLLEIAGQLHGPLAYLWARRRAAGRLVRAAR